MIQMTTVAAKEGFGEGLSRAAVEAVAASSEEVAEFIDAPAPGLSLFVQSTWSISVRAGLPTDTEAVLCQLLACDGERCWEGSLRRRDLAGPLGDSWGDPSNLKLLLAALAGEVLGDPSGGYLGGAGSTGRDRNSTLPRSEALWTCPDDAIGSPLKLSIRFLYREGPVVAVRGVDLPRTDLAVGLSRFFALAHGSQMAAAACVAAAEEERTSLQQRQEALQRKLEALPEQLEVEEERLLKEFAIVLNAQKRRCRSLWEAGRRDSARDQPLGSGPLGLRAQVAAPASIEDCLSRGDLREEAEDVFVVQNPDSVFPSLTFASPPQAFAESGTCGVFTIPLTLGMSDFYDNPMLRTTTTGVAVNSAASSHLVAGADGSGTARGASSTKRPLVKDGLASNGRGATKRKAGDSFMQSS